jgi:hypothetical protein
MSNSVEGAKLFHSRSPFPCASSALMIGSVSHPAETGLLIPSRKLKRGGFCPHYAGVENGGRLAVRSSRNVTALALPIQRVVQQLGPSRLDAVEALRME